MNKKTKFMKIFNLLTDYGKQGLVLSPYGKNPMSMNVLYMEIKNDTKIGKDILERLIL